MPKRPKKLIVCKAEQPRKPDRKLTLEKLVEAITEENRHKEIDWGQPIGKEYW